MSSYGKAKWLSISGYNSYFSTYFAGDVDIGPQISIDVSGNATKVGTGDLVIRNGNLYMSSSGLINTVPVTNLNYISTLSGLLNSLSGTVYSSSTTSSSTTSLSGIVNSLSGTVNTHTTQINSLQLGSTQAGGINVGGLNMTVYDTTGAVTPTYPGYIPIPFSSNNFSLNSGTWSAGTYVLTTSSSSTLPQYQAYNVFNSNTTSDLCWVSASGLYLNKNYKGTTTTQVTDGTSNFTISGEWIQMALPYKIILSLGNLSYGIQPRYINPAQNSPLSFTFMGSSSGNTWFLLDSKF